jgi:hypothetical protein
MPFDNKTMSMVGRPRSRRRENEYVFPPEEHDDDLAEVVASLKVDEIIELVEAGEASLDDVIAAERVGKARKTVLALVQGESGSVYPVSKTDRSNSTTESNYSPERD